MPEVATPKDRMKNLVDTFVTSVADLAKLMAIDSLKAALSTNTMDLSKDSYFDPPLQTQPVVQSAVRAATKAARKIAKKAVKKAAKKVRKARKKQKREAKDEEADRKNASRKAWRIRDKIKNKVVVAKEEITWLNAYEADVLNRKHEREREIEKV